MRGRVARALRAGLLTLLVGLLCAAALAAPAISASLDFAHSHPPGTAAHPHPVLFVIGGLPAPAPVVGVAVQERADPVRLPPVTASVCTDVRQPRSRGPPRHV